MKGYDPIGLGARIQRVRMEAHRTQRAVAAGAGMAPEYLSRIENDRVAPTMRTLLKIAGSLQISVSAFFDGKSVLEAKDRCPVTSSGRCILDHLHAGRGAGPTLRAQRYSAVQLEALRVCDFVIHHGSPEVQRTLATVLKSLFALCDVDQKRAGTSSGDAPQR